MVKRIYAFKDSYGWDKLLVDAAMRAGLVAQLISDAEHVPDVPGTYFFIHMNHDPSERNYHKQVVEEVNKKENVVLIPNILECRLYDDKVRQARMFKSWMPRTHYLVCAEDAESVLADMSLPFISKSSEGAGSSNVRLIRSQEEARAEIRLTFYGDGIRRACDLRQSGYLLWQEFLPDNHNDWRVIIIAKKYGMILKRHNRPDLPFASGSGSFESVDAISKETEGLFEHTRLFAEEFDLSFVGVDVVLGKAREPVILETTVGWDMAGYKNCRFFEFQDGHWQTTQYYGGDQQALVARAIEEGSLDPVLVGAQCLE